MKRLSEEALKERFPAPILVYVTPEVAAEMLERNNNNLPLQERYVERYTRLMREGKWVAENGVPICIDRNGNITNGQHRLWSVLNSGVAMYFWVMISSLSHDEVFGTIDTGRSRTTNAMLGVMKKQGNEALQDVNTAVMSGIARHVYIYHNAGDRAWSSVPTDQLELIEFTEELAGDPDARYAASLVTKFAKQHRRGKNWWASTVFLILKESDFPDRVPEFAEAVTEGLFDSVNDPRNALARYMRNSDTPMSTKASRVFIATAILCWNRWVQGGEMKTAGFRKNQQFPEIL